MSEVTITVKNREHTGKNKNRQLRERGSVPAVVYGDGLGPAKIQVAAKTIENLLRQAGDNAVFLLELEGTGQTRHAMIKEMDQDPRSGRLRHIDFQRVDMKQKIRLQIHVELLGEPVGVRLEGGMVDFVNREVEVECLPGKIPESVSVNIEDLHIGQHVEAKDLTLGEGVELIEDPDKVIASVSQAMIIEAEPEEDEEELLEAATAEPEIASAEAEDED